MLLIGGDKRTQDRDIERAVAMARDLQESAMARRKVQTIRYDSAVLLKTPQDIAAYLEAAMEDGDSRVIAAALGNIARAKGMSELAREAGLGRESLYKALSPDGNPEFSTILKVVRALGLRLHAEAV
jgi:probable addiction module antidote protein